MTLIKRSFGVVLGLGLLLAAPLAARAADATVTLDVHHAGCVLCGPIVKSVLGHVNGVRSVRVSQPNGMADVTATVTYDPGETTTAELTRATARAGYPSQPVADPSRQSRAR